MIQDLDHYLISAGTGNMLSWRVIGRNVPLSFTITAFKRLYRKNNCPSEIHSQRHHEVILVQILPK